MNVLTVCGPIDGAELGVTLIHEHLFIGYQGWELDRSYRYDRAALVAEAVKRLAALREHGVRTFVDPCPIELGRDVELMRQVSKQSGVHIVCTTGFYFEEHGLPAYWRMRTEADIAELLLREIEGGIDGSTIRPGAIKCATGGQYPTRHEQKFLAAACIAQKASGLPIITHTEGGLGGGEQQDFFAAKGVPLGQCLIGHSCGNADPAYHRAIVQRGSYIGFDRIGYAKFQSDEVRAENILRLLEGGWGDQLLISQDRYCGFLGRRAPSAPGGSTTPSSTQQEHDRIAALAAAGQWPPAHTYLFTDFLPKLRGMGVSDAQIARILVDNTREFLTRR